MGQLSGWGGDCWHVLGQLAVGGCPDTCFQVKDIFKAFLKK